MRTITFTVPGPPRGKGRPKFARRGQFVSTYTDEQTAAYENLVRLSYLQEAKGLEPLTGPVRLEWRANMPIPSSFSAKKRKAMIGRPHIKRPDKDNMEKAVMDGLHGVAFVDDCQVWTGDSAKVYSETPCMVVRITETEA